MSVCCGWGASTGDAVCKQGSRLACSCCSCESLSGSGDSAASTLERRIKMAGLFLRGPLAGPGDKSGAELAGLPTKLNTAQPEPTP